ncbi:MAG: hypothetical protein EBZ77_00290 [Chitinophagia bacterium]|nr:hypothetical protein [Chitinophagia bacterium]
MSSFPVKYLEPLDKQELNFLLEKERKERRTYYKVFRILMIVSFVMPFIGAWYRAYDGGPNAFSYARFFVSVGILLFISLFATYWAFRYNLRLLQKDITQRTKTVEVVRIERKTHVAVNDTFHFYISSATKLSIEVSKGYFDGLREGDELCIEYTTHAHEFMGYF